jgi:antitoxin CcdA
MSSTKSRKVPKQATNLSVNRDLLNAARESGVNLSAVLEEALEVKVAMAKREKWIRENAQAIERYNDLVAERGVFSDERRSF